MPRSHKTLPRLFLDTPLATGDAIALDKDRTNYLVNVLRREAGDVCIVFNGRDGAFRAEIEATGKKTVTLNLLEQSAPQTPPSELWCGFAPIKRLDYMVQKATEMGAGRIQPVLSHHVQNPRINENRLRANIIEAAEQCEVLTVPELEQTAKLDAVLADWERDQGDRVLVFCDEETASASPIAELSDLKGRRLGLLIGPEGGFSETERAHLNAQPFVRAISLGPRILRADTAAVAGLALIQAVAGDW